MGNELFVLDKIDMSLQFNLQVIGLLNSGKFHSILPKSILSFVPDISNLSHSLDCVNVDISVIDLRGVHFPFELQDGIPRNFLIGCLPGSLGPGTLARIVLGLEMFMAFRLAETELFAIIPDEGDSMARVDCP